MYKSIILGFEFEVDDIHIAFDDFINDTKSITGINHAFISNYHQNLYHTSQGIWRLEEDESIEWGAEFISPPMNYYYARKMCKEFFKAIENSQYVKTTYDCGLHVGMSVSGNLDSVDIENIIPSINYQLLCNLWPERMLEKHSYCNNIRGTINKVHTHSFSRNKNLNINTISNEMLTVQNSFIKLKTFENNKYLEIRVPGGENYHKKFKELFITIDHIADVLLGRITTPKKKIQKRMMSYVNRANIRTKTDLYYIKKFDPTAANNIKYLDSICNNIESKFSLYRSTHNVDDLNKHYYLYNVIKCIIINDKCINRLHNFLKLLETLLKISIPPDESQVDILRMLKLIEPSSHFSKDLEKRLTTRAHNHFIKYQERGA